MPVKDSIKLKTLLKHFYEIPEYQRDYSWQKSEQIQKFWEDLQYVKEEGIDDYFFGPVLLSDDNGNTGELHYKVIDGQQRIATVIIFLAAVRDQLTILNDKDSGVYKTFFVASLPNKQETIRLVMNKSDDHYFRSIVLTTDSPQDKIKNLDKVQSPKNLRESNQLLRDCYIYFEEAITEYVNEHFPSDKAAGVKELGNIVLDNFSVLKIRVTTIPDAYRVFTSINAKGLDLATADLIKVHLYSEAESYIDDVRLAWENMLEILDKDNVSEYIRRQWLSTHGYVPQGALFDKISKATNNPRKALDYALDLQKEVSIYKAIINPTSDESKEYLFSNMEIIYCLDALVTLGSDVTTPVLLSGLKHMSKGDFKELSYLCLNLFFRYKTICNLHAGPLQRLMPKVAVKIRQTQKIVISELKKEFGELSPKDGDFKNSFSTANIKKPNVAKYVLTQLNQYMISRAGTVDIKPIPDITLEHIVPQNEKAPAWSYLRQRHEEIVHRLGNLTLLEKKVNRDATDGPFENKQKNIYSKSSLQLNKDLMKYSQWDRDEVFSRQIEFADLAVQIWKA
jgi:uncharacterized protein with ParB-like and HNH nuclease domain